MSADKRPLAFTERCALNAVQNGAQTAREVARVTGLTEPDATDRLMRLHDFGLVECEWPHGLWKAGK